jgi:hypothetical protein
MSALSSLRTLLTADRPLGLGQLLGWAGILLSLWIVLNQTTDGIWMAGAVFPMGTLAFAAGMAARRRAYVSLTLTAIGLLLVFGLVVLGYPEGFSLALLLVAGGLFNGLAALLGYVYPEMRERQAGTEAE